MARSCHASPGPISALVQCSSGANFFSGTYISTPGEASDEVPTVWPVSSSPAYPVFNGTPKAYPRSCVPMIFQCTQSLYATVSLYLSTLVALSSAAIYDQYSDIPLGKEYDFIIAGGVCCLFKVSTVIEQNFAGRRNSRDCTSQQALRKFCLQCVGAWSWNIVSRPLSLSSPCFFNCPGNWLNRCGTHK